MSYPTTAMLKSDPNKAVCERKQPVYILFVVLLIFSEENKADSFSFAALALTLALVTTHNNPATISQQKQTKRDSNRFLTEKRVRYA